MTLFLRDTGTETVLVDPATGERLGRRAARRRLAASGSSAGCRLPAHVDGGAGASPAAPSSARCQSGPARSPPSRAAPTAAVAGAERERVAEPRDAACRCGRRARRAGTAPPPAAPRRRPRRGRARAPRRARRRRPRRRRRAPGPARPATLPRPEAGSCSSTSSIGQEQRHHAHEQHLREHQPHRAEAAAQEPRQRPLLALGGERGGAEQEAAEHDAGREGDGDAAAAEQLVVAAGGRLHRDRRRHDAQRGSANASARRAVRAKSSTFCSDARCAGSVSWSCTCCTRVGRVVEAADGDVAVGDLGRAALAEHASGTAATASAARAARAS